MSATKQREQYFRFLRALTACVTVGVFCIHTVAVGQPGQPEVTGATWFTAPQITGMIQGKPADSVQVLLQQAYANAGFLAAQVDVDSARNVAIDEGRRYLLASVTVTPDSTSQVLYDAGYRADEYIGQYAARDIIDATLKDAVRSLNSVGYPLAVASIVDVRIDDSVASVAVVLLIEPNDRVTISEISIEGNETTKRSLILAAAAVEPDEVFSDALNVSIRQRLERLNIFSSVDEPQLYKTDSGKYGLLLRVKEGNANTFDGVIGYQPGVSISEEGYFTGLVNIILRNLFGTGSRASGSWRRQTRTTSQLQLRYGQPFLFGYPLDFDGSFRQLQEEETSGLTGYVQRFFTADLYYGFSDSWYIRLGGGLDQTIPQIDSVNPCSGRQLLHSSFLSTTAGIVYDNRSNTYNPLSGVLYSTTYTVGEKSIRDIAGCLDPAISRSESRQKVGVDLETYLGIGGPFVLVNGIHYGEIRGDFLEESDLFRFGGQETVRGYREDLIRASRRTWGTTELRLILARSSFAAAFFDGGYYKRAEDRLQLLPEVDAWIYGYGVGLQIETPVGLARFSYALGEGDTFETGKVFVGLINQF